MPSRKAISVGIERMPSWADSACSASVSTLAKVMSVCCSEAASKTGAKERHGPHHSAQKSTSRMPSDEIACSKRSAVSVTVPPVRSPGMAVVAGSVLGSGEVIPATTAPSPTTFRA